MISLLKFLILIFWILDITNMPFMEMFDSTYPMNELFWWLIWFFVLGFNDEISVRGGMTMDKKKLSQLRALKKELELIDRKLDRLYERQENVPVVMGKVTGSSKDFPYVEVRTSVLMDEPKEADEIEKQIRIREKRREQVESLITEIEQFIAGIPSSRDRLIFELIYIDGKKQKEVSGVVGYSQGRVSQIIKGYLKD